MFNAIYLGLFFSHRCNVKATDDMKKYVNLWLPSTRPWGWRTS